MPNQNLKSEGDPDRDRVLDELFVGAAKIVLQTTGPEGAARTTLSELEHAIVLPGAFNPLHAGHLQMADLAARRLKRRVVFEISVKNVDKPTLKRAELERRAHQFTKHSLCFTQAATFVEKSRVFPAATFLVGADTIARIGEQRYYEGANDDAFQVLADRGCQFLVYGRVVQRQFLTLGDIILPDSLGRLCDEFSESEFRMDISSTELRQRGLDD